MDLNLNWSLNHEWNALICYNDVQKAKEGPWLHENDMENHSAKIQSDSMYSGGKKSFWTLRAFVTYCIGESVSNLHMQFILMQSPTLTHMMHLHWSSHLTTGCVSKMTSPARHKLCIRILFSYYFSVTGKQQNHFVFVGGPLMQPKPFETKPKKKSCSM